MVTGDAKQKVVFFGPEDDPLTYERAELRAGCRDHPDKPWQ